MDTHRPPPEKPTAEHVLEGCFVGFVLMASGMIGISLVFTRWLGWLEPPDEHLVQLGLWFVALAAAGYVAARHSHRTGARGLRTAMNVGLLGLLVAIARFPKPENMAVTDAIAQVLLNPLAHWHNFVVLALTVPAALLGGWMAAKMGRRTS